MRPSYQYFNKALLLGDSTEAYLVKQTHSLTPSFHQIYTKDLLDPELCDGDRRKKVLYIGKQQACSAAHTRMNMHARTLPWANRMERTQGRHQGKRQTEVEGTGGNMSLCGRWGTGKASWRSIQHSHWKRVGSRGVCGVKIMKNFRVDRRTQGGFCKAHSLPRRSEVMAGV